VTLRPGPSFTEDCVEFRVWAPRPRDIVLELVDDDRRVALTRSDDGWATARVRGLADGARYRILLDPC
jgi:1,4-alpha-glucan branching enzyme